MYIIDFLLEIKDCISNLKFTQSFVFGIIKTLIDGIAYFNIIDNTYYMQDLNSLNNIKIKSNENFKNLINYYILEQYFIFNNYNNINLLLDNNKFYSFIQIFLLNFEIFLIGIQKLMYDYIDYIKSLYN